MCPKNPRRVPGRCHTARSWEPMSRAETGGAGRHAPPGALRTTASVSPAAAALAAAARARGGAPPPPPPRCRPRRGGQGERRRPAGPVQQADERHGREDLSDLAEDRGQLGHQRYPRAGEPAGDERQYRNEDDAVTCADENASQDGHGQGRREREHELPRGEEPARGRQYDPRPEAVDEQPAGDLRGGVDGDLEEHEGGERGRADREPLRGLEPGDAEGGSVQDCEDAAEHADAPHGHGSACWWSRRFLHWTASRPDPPWSAPNSPPQYGKRLPFVAAQPRIGSWTRGQSRRGTPRDVGAGAGL